MTCAWVLSVKSTADTTQHPQSNNCSQATTQRQTVLQCQAEQAIGSQGRTPGLRNVWCGAAVAFVELTDLYSAASAGPMVQPAGRLHGCGFSVAVVMALVGVPEADQAVDRAAAFVEGRAAVLTGSQMDMKEN